MPSAAPICHIPPATTVIEQPAPLSIASVPPAQPTLQSLVSTVNQMRQVIMQLTGQQGARGPSGQAGAAGAAAASSKPTDFTQKSIQTSKVKIYQNNDPTTGNFVEVEVVNNLVMSNKNGASWTYKAAPGSSNG